MSEITKAVRFKKEEWESIQKFLSQNPLFDFSTLSRAAINEFIRKPKITFKLLNSNRPIRQKEK